MKVIFFLQMNILFAAEVTKQIKSNHSYENCSATKGVESALYMLMA